MADSRFCRECGTELTLAPSNVLQEENRKMVADAQKLFGKGRYDEAALVATAILENDPGCIDALALRGDCHERLGEYSLALECYRSILELQPESPLDRIRVARLEKMIDSEYVDLGQPTTRRRTALGAAIAAAVLLVSSGSALIIASQPPDGDFATIVDPDFTASPFYSSPPIPGPTNYRGGYQAGPESGDFVGIDSVDPTNGGISPILTRDLPPDYSVSTLPGIPGGILETTRPPRFNTGPLGGTGTTENPTVIARQDEPISDPDPKVVEDDDDGNSGMIVDVRGTEYLDPTAGSETVEDANAVITLIRVAREHFIVGDYANAASTWERALRLGASPASTNQRLAQCYEKLGNKARAISAYEKAIAAFEKLDQDNSLVKASLDSCRQALKLLRSE